MCGDPCGKTCHDGGDDRMKTQLKIRPIFLISSLMILCLGMAVVLLTAQRNANAYADLQLDAAVRMENAEAYLKTLILEKEIAIEPEDLNHTALIGPDFTELTSTPGEIGAKRSSLNPEFAAAMVRYFHQAGVKKGDTIAIGTSGSFPGFLIATLCAATQMELDVKVIASLGASMHGATRVSFNIFDILEALKMGGYADFAIVGISCGSENDNGGSAFEGFTFEGTEELSVALCQDYAKRFETQFIYYRNLSDAIAKRLELYGSDVKLFVNIGGAAANSGKSNYTLDFPQGLVTQVKFIPETNLRGLNYEFIAQGIPVLNLLNVKLLCQENGIPFDPIPMSKAGETSVYLEVSYNKVMILVTLVLAAAVFVLGVCDGYFRRRRLEN